MEPNQKKLPLISTEGEQLRLQQIGGDVVV